MTDASCFPWKMAGSGGCRSSSKSGLGPTKKIASSPKMLNTFEDRVNSLNHQARKKLCCEPS